MQPLKVFCPLHGIRTLALWQKGLSDLATSKGWVCRLDRWSYGRFSLLAFFTPWTREAKLNWLRRQYDAEIHDQRLKIEQGQTPSVVAHSFGTYILGYALLRFDFIRFNKVILCGSILPTDFPWDKLIERGQVQAVRNEYGVRDPWVKRLRCFVRGTGPSGASGFTCKHDRLEQEEFEYNHGDYFGIDHMEDRWIPFLNEPLEEVPRAKDAPRISRPRSSAPWCLYGLMLTALLLGAVLSGYLVVRWNGRPAPAPENGYVEARIVDVIRRREITRGNVIDVTLTFDKQVPNGTGTMIVASPGFATARVSLFPQTNPDKRSLDLGRPTDVFDTRWNPGNAETNFSPFVLIGKTVRIYSDDFPPQVHADSRGSAEEVQRHPKPPPGYVQANVIDAVNRGGTGRGKVINVTLKLDRQVQNGEGTMTFVLGDYRLGRVNLFPQVNPDRDHPSELGRLTDMFDTQWNPGNAETNFKPVDLIGKTVRIYSHDFPPKIPPAWWEHEG